MLFIDYLWARQLKKKNWWLVLPFCLPVALGKHGRWIDHQAAQGIRADLPKALNSPKGLVVKAALMGTN